VIEVRVSAVHDGVEAVHTIQLTPVRAAGARLASRLPLFLSGVHYPDFALISPTMLESGIEGVRRAGFFDLRWQINEHAE
jgi:hypothetical protein